MRRCRKDATLALRRYLDARRKFMRVVIEQNCWSVGIKSPVISGMPRARGGHKDLSDIIVSKESDLEKIEAAKVEVEEARKEVETLIDVAGMTDWEKEVVRCRYLDALGTGCRMTVPWTLISEMLGVTYQSVTHAHDRGVDKVMQVLADETEGGEGNGED